MMMSGIKNLIKKSIGYSFWYDQFSRTPLYTGFKKAYALCAASVYGKPAKDFFVIGVTGTNGKTTTCQLVAHMFGAVVGDVVLVSTEGVYIKGEKIDVHTKATSYDSFVLQNVLAKAREDGVQIAVIEVSSHGLDQSRFAGIEFDMAILTNITPEHLDYHKTMENYVAAKKKLFEMVVHNTKNNKLAVLPKDDQYGRAWAEDIVVDRMITYGQQSSAGLRAVEVVEKPMGTEFVLEYLGHRYTVQTTLVGRHNVSNTLAALSACVLASIDIKDAIACIEKYSGVPGRLQNMTHNQVHYYVDYAHTPDALEKTLTTLSSLVQNTPGRLLVLRGAAGNRDISNRKSMGSILLAHSDILILTEDDSENENRLSILADVLEDVIAHAPEGEGWYSIPERSYAMDLLLSWAQPHDIVLIAGKGHEHVLYSNYGTRQRDDWKMLGSRLSLSTNSVRTSQQ